MDNLKACLHFDHYVWVNTWGFESGIVIFRKGTMVKYVMALADSLIKIVCQSYF